MTDAQTSESMSPGHRKVAERAKREPEARFNSLAHLMDQGALARAYHRLRKQAAVGVDGVTKEQYGQDLEGNLADLHERLKTKRYRHQPIRRVHIPKDGGKTRPIGVSALEDKIVQGAVRDVLEAIYEQDFLDCSYGFRPGRSAHDAIRAVHRAVDDGSMHWVLEADIVSFFDSVDRNALKEMLQLRVADGSLMRLIGKCLHVGILDGAEYYQPGEGTTQGSVLSPLLGNIYLHHVLDQWFETVVKVRLRGRATLVRYADDFIIGFELEADARKVMDVLGRRLGRFGLALHPDKTRLIRFQRPPRSQTGGKGPGGFDFLGFTVHWQRRQKGGGWRLACKTRRVRLGRSFDSIREWCRRYRHLPVGVQHAALSRRVRGHLQYFGVNGNLRSLAKFVHGVERIWWKWLRRRSQRSRWSWERFNALLQRRPLPRPRVHVQIWS